MNQLEFSFEPSAWETVLDTLPRGGSLSAVRFLTMMESESEETLEDALALLEQRDILLDISDLPKPAGTGEAAVRMHREEELVKQGKLPAALDENDPLRLYLEEIAGIPVCGDPQLLALECLAGNENAMPRLTDLMLSRVVEHAFRLAGRGVLLLDLIQEGSLGLWQAILGYEGGEFEPYCDRRICATLAKTLVLQAREDGVGQKMRQALEDYRSVDEKLLTELGRNPTLEEIAQELHMTVQDAAMVSEMLKTIRALDKAKPPMEEQVREEDDQAVEDTAYFRMRQRIQELLSVLDSQSAQILTLRFGLEGGLPLTPEQTGRKLELTPEEVVAAEAAALAKLRTEA